MRKDSGFTLVELFTIIALIAIMSAVAVPSMLSWRSNAHLRRATQDVYSAFYRAKTEAVRRNTFVTITFSADDFVIYLDANDDWSYNPADNDQRIAGPIRWSQYAGVSVDSLSFSNPSDGIGLSVKGFPMDKDNNLVAGAVILTNEKNIKKRISITPAGSIRINRQD